MEEFKLNSDIVELASIQDVEDALRSKIEWYERNEPYATETIRQLETALYIVSELTYDME